MGGRKSTLRPPRRRLNSDSMSASLKKPTSSRAGIRRGNPHRSNPRTASEHRAEQSQLSDAIAATKIRNLGLGDLDLRHYHTSPIIYSAKVDHAGNLSTTFVIRSPG